MLGVSVYDYSHLSVRAFLRVPPDSADLSLLRRNLEMPLLLVLRAFEWFIMLLLVSGPKGDNQLLPFLTYNKFTNTNFTTSLHGRP